MKIAITGIIGVSKGYGGFETLAENLIGEGSPITTVYCSSKYFENKPRVYKGAKLVYLPIDSKGFTKIFHTGLSLIHAALTGHSKLLLLGVSGGIALPLIRLLFPSTKIITNIDGLEWQRGKWNYFVKKYLKVSEYLCCKLSHVVIADNPILVDYVKHSYGIEPIGISYGGDQALAGRAESGSQAEKFRAFSLCRIVPENNVHLILEAFSRIDRDITFVGNWSASKYGKSLKEKFTNVKNIEMIDPVFDVENLYRMRSECHVYIHGHSVGGTNPALVEMMHFGKPIIAFDCSYNRATLENNGLFFSDVDDLVKKVSNLNSLDVLSGVKIREIARVKYTWAIVRKEYFKVLGN